MKKVLFALAAVVALAACSKEDTLVQQAPEAIGFDNAFVENSTRSVYDPSYTNTKLFGNFGVFGTVEGASLFDGVRVAKGITNTELKSDWKYAGTYVDNGFSGTNTAHRPGFLKLIEDARAGKIDMIITKAVSRFARNLLDCISYIDELKNLDPPVRVFFEQENLDTGLQTSGIILFVLAMVAEEESHMKSEAMLLSLEWRFSRGRFLTPSLFGYTASP